MNELRIRAGHRAGFLLGALLPAAALQAQQDPSCVAPFSPTTNRADEPMRPLWGGETRHVFSLQIAGVEHTWVVGDGGFVRHRVGTGAFEIQGTPLDARFSLHDVFFLPDGTKGWATGNGGRILETNDRGATWTLLPPTLPGCFGKPATIWRVRFLDAMHGFVCGLQMFCVTTDGGHTWSPVSLANGSAPTMEFYSLEVLGTVNDFVAVAAGQTWGGHCSSGNPGPAAIFRLGGSGTAAVLGSWATASVNLPPNVDMCEDPWDIEFEPSPASIHAATGWLCGGTGTAAGMILRSNDSGANWNFEYGGAVNPGFNTCYGIGVRNATEAVAVGYGGVVQWRDAVGIWRPRKFKDPQGINFTGPLSDATWTDGPSPTCVITGSWGFLRQRSDFTSSTPPAGTWNDLQTASALSNPSQDRYFDVAFRDDLNGFLVGQNGDIVATADGGCSLAPVTFVAGSTPPTATLVGVDYSNGKRFAIAVGTNGGHHNVAYNDNANVPNSHWTRYSGTDLPSSASFVDVDFLTGQVAWALGTQAANNQGNSHLMARTETGGVKWDAFQPAFDSKFTATGFVGIGANEGIVVGSIGTPAVPAAYEVLLLATGVSVQPIACPPGLTGKLNDVAGRGDSLALCDVLAVGGVSDDLTGQGYVLRYVPGSSTTSSMFVIDGLPAAIEFTTVAMAGGGFTLVGMRQRASVRFASSFGQVLVRSNGVNPTWSFARSRTNKPMRAIHVASNLRAWLLAKGDGEDITGEFGTVNDSTLLLWDPQ
ncbi:MAG: hypothetical protein MUC36_14605 [Planctomycetes bacterium]|jgi:photosystem II stability/assembly factor-like uncharacterized protein|nr:hypothetical protein [Planctomycetota bacterium]